MLAVQRAAKQRAAMEISGTHLSPAGRGSASGGGSSLTGGVRSKIRHHGAPKAQQYAPTTNPASGVPMRLSAREVDEEDSDDDNYATKTFHDRSGSGRSSVGSAGRVASAYGLQGMTPGRSSSGGNTPPQSRGQTTAAPSESVFVGNRPREMSDTTPMANQQLASSDYFGGGESKCWEDADREDHKLWRQRRQREQRAGEQLRRGERLAATCERPQHGI